MCCNKLDSKHRLVGWVSLSSTVFTWLLSTDDNAPTKRKGLWLACLYTCSPFGIGLGYILGGFAGAAWNWRVVFYIEAGVMVPFFLCLILAPAVDIKKGEFKFNQR